jgi:hypothetical protein
MWNCKETGKQVHLDMLARAHLCPRRLNEFQKKRKIKRNKLFCRRPKRNERRRRKIEESQYAWDQIKGKWEKKKWEVRV